MIRYGIISTAQIVPRFVAGVKESQEGQVVAVASRTLSKAQKLAEVLDIPKAYGSYEELTADADIDVVYIATYNKGHYEAAKLALTHHKHVLLEKPFTLLYKEAQELFQLAERNGCFLMEAQKALFLPITQQVKEVIRQGKLGKIRWVNSVSAYKSVDHITWFHSIDAGGGMLHGAGSYPLHYLRYLFGQPDSEVKSTAVQVSKGVDTNTQVTMVFNHELLATVTLMLGLSLDSQLTIYGEAGTLKIPDFWKTDTASISYEDGRTEVLNRPYTSEFVFEVNHVNQCIREGRLTSPIMTRELTLATVKMVEEMYQEWQLC